MEKAINNERNLISRNVTFIEGYYEINYDYIDILFIVDATQSMAPYINACIKNCLYIVQTIELKFSYKIKKYGAIFYRDPIDRKEDKHTYIQLTSDKNEFQNQIETIKAFGGNDYAEDWNGAYEIALNKINWTNERGNKIVIHIADASAHGNEFIEPGIEDKHPCEGRKFIKTIKKVAKKGIKIIGFPVGKYPPINSFTKLKEIYKKNNGSIYMYKNILYVDFFANITKVAIKHIEDNLDLYY
jgi:hypothetical protein